MTIAAVPAPVVLEEPQASPVPGPVLEWGPLDYAREGIENFVMFHAPIVMRGMLERPLPGDRAIQGAGGCAWHALEHLRKFVDEGGGADSSLDKAYTAARALPAGGGDEYFDTLNAVSAKILDARGYATAIVVLADAILNDTLPGDIEREDAADALCMFANQMEDTIDEAAELVKVPGED